MAGGGNEVSGGRAGRAGKWVAGWARGEGGGGTGWSGMDWAGTAAATAIGGGGWARAGRKRGGGRGRGHSCN